MSLVCIKATFSPINVSEDTLYTELVRLAKDQGIALGNSRRGGGMNAIFDFDEGLISITVPGSQAIVFETFVQAMRKHFKLKNFEFKDRQKFKVA